MITATSLKSIADDTEDTGNDDDRASNDNEIDDAAGNMDDSTSASPSFGREPVVRRRLNETGDRSSSPIITISCLLPVMMTPPPVPPVTPPRLVSDVLIHVPISVDSAIRQSLLSSYST